MATRSVATVFGGSGFLGRYIVKRLAQAGNVVRVAGRDTEAAKFLQPMGSPGQIVPLFAPLSREADIARAVEGADMVVNLIGILTEPRAGDFQRIQGEGATRIARAAAAAGVTRMVQMSAIGADPASRSAYGRSKAAGEAGVQAAIPTAVVLRPSLVFGTEDKFFNRFANLARSSPVMPVIAGDSRFQPVYVGDVADATMAALTHPDAAGKTFELGGPRVWTFRELLVWILATVHRHRPLLEVPMRVAELQARVAELLPGKPLTRDQLLLLSQDNVVSPGMPGLADLGVAATPVELIVPRYLARYRTGGGRREQYTV